MSGHSHAKTIKHKKSLEDQKRGKIFSKLARRISIAAKDGNDPETNPKLKQVLQEAKDSNLPKENIERAVNRGTGELEGVRLEEVVFEAFGPGGIALIIEGITDNKNRTLGEIKQILNQGNGKLANSGSVKWLFERKGCIILRIANQHEYANNKEGLELLAIEAGAEDINWHNDILDIYTKPEKLEKAKKYLEEKGIEIDSSSLGLVAKDEIQLNEKEKKACQKLFEALDENEAVQEIYSNLKT